MWLASPCQDNRLSRMNLRLERLLPMAKLLSQMTPEERSKYGWCIIVGCTHASAVGSCTCQDDDHRIAVDDHEEGEW